jgi:hypothetical protein
LNHKIVLLVDNCTAHVVKVNLKHIKVIFLPANTTALIQPCDQGIIRTMKAYYRREMRSRILETMEEGKNLTANELAKKTNILDALHLLTMSWKSVSEKTIKNCFSHGGFTTVDLEAEEIIEKPTDLTDEAFNNWMAIDQNIQISEKLTESEICHTVSQNSLDPDDEEDEEEDQECSKPPTAIEIRTALQILRRGVQHRSSDFNKQYEYESFINGLLRKNAKQTTLKDFF